MHHLLSPGVFPISTAPGKLLPFVPGLSAYLPLSQLVPSPSQPGLDQDQTLTPVWAEGGKGPLKAVHFSCFVGSPAWIAASV